MTDKELWRRMENLSLQEQSLKRDMEFMLLLKTAYDKDMKLIMACTYDPLMPGMARQGFMEAMRFGNIRQEHGIHTITEFR